MTIETETTTPVADLPRPRRQINWIRLAPWIYTIALFLIWEIAVRALGIRPTILPAPSAIAGALWQYWPAIQRHSIQTLFTTTLGFALAVVGGLALGLLIGWSRMIYAGLYPIMSALTRSRRSPLCRSSSSGSASARSRPC